MNQPINQHFSPQKTHKIYKLHRKKTAELILSEYEYSLVSIIRSVCTISTRNAIFTYAYFHGRLAVKVSNDFIVGKNFAYNAHGFLLLFRKRTNKANEKLEGTMAGNEKKNPEHNSNNRRDRNY